MCELHPYESTTLSI